MIPQTFEYKRPKTLNEAISMMGNGATLLAGGHSLIPAMKLRLNQPDTLIDISRISDLKYIKEDGNFLAIGALTTHSEVVHSKLIRKLVPMLSLGAGMIGDVQVRNMGTIGGSLAHADPAADWPAMIVATNGSIRIAGKNGSREVPAENFFTGFFETALKENEMITEIRIPKPASGTRSSYQKFHQPASRFAIVGCAATVTLENGKCKDTAIAFNGVSEAVFRDSAVEDALKGKSFSDENIATASTKAAEGVFVLSDPFASEKYRKHLAKVYVKKALEACR